jgi:hypothetical protein
MTGHGTSETSRRDPAKRHRPENADSAWLGGHAGGYLLQHSAKKRIFVIAITSLAQRRR